MDLGDLGEKGSEKSASENPVLSARRRFPRGQNTSESAAAGLDNCTGSEKTTTTAPHNSLRKLYYPHITEFRS